MNLVESSRISGVGDSHGTTTFSQYQDELNTINSMITSMLPEIERIER